VDTIRFEIDERAVPADGLVDAIDTFVNGRNFVDILREVELPFVRSCSIGRSTPPP
jgi:hypothetical protein